MKFILASFLALFTASCSISSQNLLSADISRLKEPRKLLKAATFNNAKRDFIYINRKYKILYVFGHDIDGFNLNKTNINKIKIGDPELFNMVKCVSSKNCDGVKKNICTEKIVFSKEITKEQENEIVNEFKFKGYPVTSIDFKSQAGKKFELEVSYFTECEFIKFDVAEFLNKFRIGFSTKSENDAR